MAGDRQTRRLAAVASRLDALTVERDELIVELRDRGMSLRSIAALAGLTHVGVLRVVERIKARL